ncbi:two-component system, NarL family, sensor histidine kinase LiaS [Marininema mesophilum]|uniref:Oxygen sensor histidine kinase NreB n=1 Tax=Marininema mesophilum TaxID=1048340 RepID=A0A1H3B4L0_9BACL|nr:sensor histidine kinase [Marininema mesophilum]SDX36618.1 two-component system, NarL family, sensor histidine kinase LiaS [Marininema mesophilum]
MSRSRSDLRWDILSVFIINNCVALLLCIGGFLIVHGTTNLPLLFSILIVSALVPALYFGLKESNRLKNSLQPLRDGAVFLANGKLSHRVPEKSGADIIDDIADQWNHMAERLETQVDALQKLLTRNRELADQSKQLAIIEERQRLARELHDSVSQQLFAISMTASALVNVAQTTPSFSENLRSSLGMLEETAAKAQDEMRALLLHLRPIGLENQGLKPALEQLLTELAGQHSFQLEWELEDIPSIGRAMEEHLFRITQEALSNLLRHSKATYGNILLQHRQETLFLTVEDNGVGFSETDRKKSSYGLATIRERTQEMGGDVRIVSVKEKGTRLEIRIPSINKEEKSP